MSAALHIGAVLGAFVLLATLAQPSGLEYKQCHVDEMDANGQNQLFGPPTRDQRQKHACFGLLMTFTELSGNAPDPPQPPPFFQGGQTPNIFNRQLGRQKRQFSPPGRPQQQQQQQQLPSQQLDFMSQMRLAHSKICPVVQRTIEDNRWQEHCCDVLCLCEEVSKDPVNGDNSTCGGKFIRQPPQFGNANFGQFGGQNGNAQQRFNLPHPQNFRNRFRPV